MLFFKINYFRYTRFRSVSVKFIVFTEFVFRFSVFLTILFDRLFYLVAARLVLLPGSCDFVAFVFKFLLFLVDDFHRSFHIIELFFPNFKFTLTICLNFFTSLHLREQSLTCFVIFLAIKSQLFTISKIFLNILSYSSEVMFNLFEVVVWGAQCSPVPRKSAFKLIYFLGGFFKLVFKTFVRASSDIHDCRVNFLHLLLHSFHFGSHFCQFFLSFINLGHDLLYFIVIICELFFVWLIVSKPFLGLSQLVLISIYINSGHFHASLSVLQFSLTFTVLSI